MAGMVRLMRACYRIVCASIIDNTTTRFYSSCSRRTSNTNQYSLATERLQLDFETHAAAMETPNMRGALSGAVNKPSA